MAQRGAPHRQLIGNPLGGILRDQERALRTVTGPQGGGALTSYAAVVTLNGGEAAVTFPRAFTTVPVVTATSQGVPLVCYVASATVTDVTVKAVTIMGAVPPDGVVVHVQAVAAAV